MSTEANDLEELQAPAKIGRPTSYQTYMLPIVRSMAKAGCTEWDIAEGLGIDTSTLWMWKSKYPRFSNALELGKKQSTKRVERALYHRAVGYTHKAEKVFNDKGKILKTEITEHLPPDTNAAIFWLKNKKPEAWQDRSSVDMTGSINLVAQTLSNARQRALQAKSTPPALDAGAVPTQADDSDDTD